MSSSTEIISPAGGTPRRGPDAITPSSHILAILFRRFLSCNPLYLASAGLLLYGVNKLSVAPGFVGAEPEQITFNFAALFLYEILLVVTAIVLARREIWYDALLLVGLENLFVLVPFSLVSRAAHVNEPLARNLCWAAVLLAVFKFWGLKRYIPRLNLPPPLLWLGAAALGINVALSLGLRDISEDAKALNFWITLGWMVALPGLLALGLLLPKPRHASTSPEQNPWLPFGALIIWIAATAGHLGGVGYVYSYDWHLAKLAPTVWVLSWLLVRQTRAHRSTTRSRWLVGLPLVVALLAIGDERTFFTLGLLNAATYAVFWKNQLTGKLAAWLCLASIAMTVASVPAEWLTRLIPEFNRAEWVLACLAALAFWPVIRSRDPRWGIAGGLLWLIAGGALAYRLQISPGWAVQLGLTFVAIHSLRWTDEYHDGSKATRLLTCLVWFVHSLLWLHFSGREATLSTQIFGALVVSTWFGHWLWSKTRPPQLVLMTAGVVLLASPGYRLTVMASNIPAGYLAVAVSFILFGLGTIAALTRKQRGKRATQ